MKIAVVSRVAHPLHGAGGLERHTGALVHYLARAGETVTLYTTPPSSPDARIEDAVVRVLPYRVLPWPRRAPFVVASRITNYLLWSLRAGRAALRDSPDVVHAEAGAGFGYAFVRRAGSAPLVLQAQGMEEFKAELVKRTAYLPLRRATRFAARRAARVIVPDRAMESEVDRYLGPLEEKKITLPLAVDLEAIDRAIADASRQSQPSEILSPELPVLLSVGRLEANKGFDGLVEALARQKNELPSAWAWLLVGSGPEESRLRARVEEAGLSHHVRFLGAVSDDVLVALYQRADLFVHPTLYEGSSLVTLEAMAHGKPVVASCVGGIPDKVIDGTTGFLVPPANPEALGAAITGALNARGRLAEMGAAGRKRVEAEFSWSQRVRRLVELYREVVESSVRIGV